MVKKIIFLIFVISLLSGVSKIQAQTNFFTKVEDSLSNDFYTKQKTATVFATFAYPALTYGVTTFIHNNTNRLSYLVGVQMNAWQKETLSGEAITGEGTEQKIVPYSSYLLNVGLAYAFSAKTFVYGYVGSVYSYSSFKNKPGDDFVYRNIPSGITYNLGAGIAYVATNKISYLIGLQMYNRSVIVGLGYTF